MPLLPEHCQEHGESIARILAQTTAIEAHLRALNGRTGRNEDQIAALSVKQGAHDVIQTQIMRTLGPLEDSMGNMKDWRAGMVGGAEQRSQTIKDWMVVFGLLITFAAVGVSLWQGSMQREALMLEVQQIKHATVK
jgi:hypothetical protein